MVAKNARFLTIKGTRFDNSTEPAIKVWFLGGLSGVTYGTRVNAQSQFFSLSAPNLLSLQNTFSILMIDISLSKLIATFQIGLQQKLSVMYLIWRKW